MNLEKWKKFFYEAGIPASDASTYAFKFAQNRIQTDMLVDLNKDYLKDMGITIMGDVIAVLRHAKQVYEDIQKTSRSEFLDGSKDKKEKEITKKVPKKSPAESTATKTEVPKLSTKLAVKRKSESSAVSLKKTALEQPKKPKIVVNDDNIEECEDLGYVMIDSSKKSVLFKKKLPKNVESHLKNIKIGKSSKMHDLDPSIFHPSEDDDDDNVEVIIDDPIVNPFGGYKKFVAQDTNSRSKEQTKCSQDPSKRTVFKRLGEEISQHSVTSTTPFEEDEQLSLSSKKSRDDTSKLTQEKNSVFQRLGQKCDVTSTSIEPLDKFSIEERKTVKTEIHENISKIQLQFNTSKNISRKMKVEKHENSDKGLPSCVKSTYSEGILAANGTARKLTMKDRVGLPRISNSTPRSETEYRNEIQTKRMSDGYFSQKRVSSTKKRVSFGSVSEKLIPNREEAIRTGELPEMVEKRTSVFERLGFNRTY